VSAISCQLASLLVWILQIYTVILIVYAILSWIPELRGRWSSYLAMLVEPVLNPLRRIIPPLGGLDLSFLVLILALQFLVRPLIAQLAFNVCYGPY
jgi:YggT family protein